MGDVLTIMRIMPTGVETDLKKVAAEINNIKPKPHSIEEKPLAFGIKFLEVKFVTPDKEGGTDAIEDAIRKIKGVENVEVTGLTLI